MPEPEIEEKKEEEVKEEVEEKEETEEKEEEKEEEEKGEEKEEPREETIPRERFDEVLQRAKDAEARLDERRKAAPTKEEADLRFEEDFDKDRHGAIRRTGHSSAYDVLDYEQAKTDAVEEFVDNNPQFQKDERAIKRKLRKFDYRDPTDLKERVELEFYAAQGKGSRERETKAHKKGKDDATKQKKVIGTGAGTGTTPSKSDKEKPLTTEEATFETGMGITSEQKKKAKQFKGNAVE